MNKLLPVLAISVLFLTGCSTPTLESKPEYDEVELLKYEACLKTVIEKGKPNFDLGVPKVMQGIETLCEFRKPRKQ